MLSTAERPHTQIHNYKEGITLDKFDNRLESYSATELQFSVALEDIVRKNFGKLSSTFFFLKPERGEISFGDFDGFIENLSKSDKFGMIIRATGECLCLGKDNFAFRLLVSQSTELDGEGCYEMDDDIPAMAYTNGDDGKKGMIQQFKITIYYTQESLPILEAFEKLCEEHHLLKQSQFEVGKNELPVTFAFPGTRGIEYHTHSFPPIELDSIAGNYTPGVVRGVKKFIAHADEASHGIFLINGPVGVGKSYLIRSLITGLPKRRAVICSPPSDFLVNAGLLRTVVTNFNKSLIVFEDVGEIVAVDSVARYADARANLLNLSEGLMSLLMNGIILISFNYDIDKIDPAILRPGRCLAHIEVGKLPYAQAKDLIPFEVKEKEYSLAEIYEMKNRKEGEEAPPPPVQTRKLGF